MLLPFTATKRKIVFLHGLGGIGKSQLAIEFAKKHRLDYTAVLWLNAKTEDTLKQSFAANARRLPKEFLSQDALDGPQNEESLNTILREMKAWLGLPGNDRWLLIYDNVDNPKIADNKDRHAYDIQSYFPEAHQGSILVTTRWKTLRIGKPIEVAKLSKDEESISLLLQTSDRVIMEGESLKKKIALKSTLMLEIDAATKDLLRKLDGLPLALATAGAYLGLTGISVSEYLDHYDTSWLELQQTSPSLSAYEETIYSTWNLSYMLIRKEDPSAAKLLEFWAYFANRDLWYELLDAGKVMPDAPDWFLGIINTKLAFNSAMGKLQKHALIERMIESDGYSMHHCVHAWVKTVLRSVGDNQSMKLALKCVGNTVPFEPAPGDWMIKQRLFPYAEHSLWLLREWNDESKNDKRTEKYVAQSYGKLGVLYHYLGKLTEAESIYKRALISKEMAFGQDHRSTLSTVQNLGNLYLKQDRLTEAKTIYKRVLLGQEKVLGRDHISTLETVSNLGLLYIMQGKLTEAESMLERALIGQEKVLKRHHIRTLNTVNNLGLLYLEQGKLMEAETMFERALIGHEKGLGRDHMLTLNTVNNLGASYIFQGKLTEAETLFERALIGHEKGLGRDHMFTLNIVNSLGVFYDYQGKLTEAETMFERALIGHEKVLGRDHPFTLNTVNNLGILHRKQGKLAEAESMSQRALIGYEKAFGRDHASTLNTVYSLGSLYKQQGKLAEAESMYERVLVGYNRNPPPKVKTHLDLSYTMGLLSRDMKNFERAKEYFGKAHEGHQKLLGPQHAETMRALRRFNRETERSVKAAKSPNKSGES